jgi:hypothetical protein
MLERSLALAIQSFGLADEQVRTGPSALAEHCARTML